MNTTEILQGLKKDPNDYCSQTKARAWNAALDSAIAALGEGDVDSRRYAAMDMPHPSNFERHMDFQAVYKTWCTVNYSMIWKAIYNWQCIFDGVSKVKVGRTKGQNIKFVQLCFIDDQHADEFNAHLEKLLGIDDELDTPQIEADKKEIDRAIEIVENHGKK